MTSLPGKLVAIHGALERSQIPHAFGGAIALAYCTRDPRGTSDIDVNVFVHPDGTADVFAALPHDVATTRQHLAAAKRDAQVRLWWDEVRRLRDALR